MHMSYAITWCVLHLPIGSSSSQSSYACTLHYRVGSHFQQQQLLCCSTPSAKGDRLRASLAKLSTHSGRTSSTTESFTEFLVSAFGNVAPSPLLCRPVMASALCVWYPLKHPSTSEKVSRWEQGSASAPSTTAASTMSQRREHLRSTMLQLEGRPSPLDLPSRSPRKSSPKKYLSPKSAKADQFTPALPIVAYSWPRMEGVDPPQGASLQHSAFCAPISTWSLNKRVVVFFVLWAVVGTIIALAVYFSNRATAVEEASQSSTDESSNGLDFHNKFRAQFEDTPVLKWNDTLAHDAAEWAANCNFEHAGSGSHGEGENLSVTRVFRISTSPCTHYFLWQMFGCSRHQWMCWPLV